MENKNTEQKVKKFRGRPITVAGNYDSKKYYQTFKEKNNDKIREKVKCDVCGGVFSYFNKSHHKQSKMHIKATSGNFEQSKNEEVKNVVVEELLSKEMEIEITEKPTDKIVIVETE